MPAIRPPPNWEANPLSTFLQATHNNQMVTAARKRVPFSRLSQIDRMFVRVAENIVNPANITAINLFYRCHSAFRAACGASMAGQVTESFALNRSCLENAAYALHIQDNPGHDMIWWERNSSKRHKQAVRDTFALGALRATVSKHDSRLSAVFDELYERAIDFGGHPNQFGVASGMSITEGPERTAIKHTYLHANSIQMDITLKTTAQVGICALRLAQFMMPQKFLLLGVRDGILNTERGL